MCEVLKSKLAKIFNGKKKSSITKPDSRLDTYIIVFNTSKIIKY